MDRSGASLNGAGTSMDEARTSMESVGWSMDRAGTSTGRRWTSTDDGGRSMKRPWNPPLSPGSSFSRENRLLRENWGERRWKPPVPDKISPVRRQQVGGWGGVSSRRNYNTRSPRPPNQVNLECRGWGADLSEILDDRTTLAAGQEP